MTASQRTGGERLMLDGGSLGRLCFDWQGDRYQHRWSFGESERVAIESIESDASVIWPGSPPLQQIHRQTFGDGRDIVFGLGMAGRGHWSASFTLVPDLKCWIVELACRAPATPESLGSRYRVHGDCWRQEDAGVQSQWEQQQLRIEPIRPGSRFDLTEDSVFSLMPVEMNIGNSTNQWAFRLRVTAPPVAELVKSFGCNKEDSTNSEV